MLATSSPKSPEQLAKTLVQFFSKSFSDTQTAEARAIQILEAIRSTYTSEGYLMSAYQRACGYTAIADQITTLITQLKTNDGKASIEKIFAFIEKSTWIIGSIANQFISKLLAENAVVEQALAQYLANDQHSKDFVSILRFSMLGLLINAPIEMSVVAPAISEEQNLLMTTFPFSAMTAFEIALHGFQVGNDLEVRETLTESEEKKVREAAADFRLY